MRVLLFIGFVLAGLGLNPVLCLGEWSPVRIVVIPALPASDLRAELDPVFRELLAQNPPLIKDVLGMAETYRGIYVFDVNRSARSLVAYALRSSVSAGAIFIEDLDDVLEPALPKPVPSKNTNRTTQRLTDFIATAEALPLSLRYLTTMNLLGDFLAGSPQQVGFHRHARKFDGIVHHQLELFDALCLTLKKSEVQAQAAADQIMRLLKHYDFHNIRTLKLRILGSLRYGGFAGLQQLESSPQRRQEYIQLWMRLLQSDIDFTEGYLRMTPRERRVISTSQIWPRPAVHVPYENFSGSRLILGYFENQGEPFVQSARGDRIPHTTALLLGSRQSEVRQFVKNNIVSFLLSNETRIEKIANLHLKAYREDLESYWDVSGLQLEMSGVTKEKFGIDEQIFKESLKIVGHPSLDGLLRYLVDTATMTAEFPSGLSQLEYQRTVLEILNELMFRSKSDSFFGLVVDSALTLTKKLQKLFDDSKTEMPKSFASEFHKLSQSSQQALINALRFADGNSTSATHNCAQWLIVQRGA